MTYTKLLCFLILFLMYKVNYSNGVMEEFIVGGVKTNIMSYPHSVFLQILCGYKSVCGGAIINQRIVLTAAHCFEGCWKKRAHTVQAFAGSEDVMKANILRSITTLLIHGGYDIEECVNDIALGATKDNFPLGNTMKRVIIKRTFPRAQAGSVAGWGLVDESHLEFSTILKSVQQIIKPKATCAKIGYMHPGMFCAGIITKKDEHPAPGDSGSAFINKQYQQLGLVSYRHTSLPSLTVYTNVSYYYPWIKANSKQILCYQNSTDYIQL